MSSPPAQHGRPPHDAPKIPGALPHWLPRWISPTLRARILVQSGVQLGGKAATMLSGLVLFPILTRYLGVNGFGSYIFITGYISLFATLTDFGSQAIAVREMARHGGQAARVAGQFFTAKAALSLAATLVALGIAVVAPISAFHKPGVLFGTIVAALALTAAPIGGTATAIFQMSLRMAIPVLADVMSRVLVLVGVIALAAGVVAGVSTAADRLDAVLVLTTIVGVLASLAAFVGARRLMPFRPILYDAELLKPMVRDTVPLGVVLVVGIVHYRIDVFILAAMKGNGSVGLYGIATKLLDVSLAVSAMFMSVAFPVLSRRAFGDQVLLRRAFQKSLDFMLIVGLGIAIVAAILSPSLVHFLGGAKFVKAVLPLSVIAWAVPIMFVNQVFSHMVVAGNRQLVGVPVVLGAAMANVALNVALIPHLGTVAPALVTVITEGISAAGMAIVMIRYFGFGPSPQSLARILASGGVAALAMLLLSRFGPLVSGGLGMTIYGIALVAGGVVGRNDVVALLTGEATL